MKKLLISKGVQDKIPQDLSKEIYNIISHMPTSGIWHMFRFKPTENGLSLEHSIPSTMFFYTLYFSKDFGIHDIIDVVAYDKSDRIMMSLYTELI